MNKPDKEILYTAIAVLYILLAITTSVYYNKRHIHAEDKLQKLDNVVVGAFWPLYWTYRLIDLVVDPEPLPPPIPKDQTMRRML